MVIEVEKPQSKPKRGRKCDYTTAIADYIVEEMAAGRSLRDICLEPDMPDQHTVRCWAVDIDEFAPRYARTRDRLLEHWADEIIDTGRDAMRLTDAAQVQAYKLHVDNLKWTLSKLKPERYGDRLDLHQTGTVHHVKHVILEVAAPQTAIEGLTDDQARSMMVMLQARLARALPEVVGQSAAGSEPVGDGSAPALPSP